MTAGASDTWRPTLALTLKWSKICFKSLVVRTMIESPIPVTLSLRRTTTDLLTNEQKQAIFYDNAHRLLTE
ncbi:hypothetical protein WP50_04955 [Lactiplantibacillus plantarum]|nr:hypothetical protein WP50_04955 [Lactiplantibacillus plantarum]